MAASTAYILVLEEYVLNLALSFSPSDHVIVYLIDRTIYILGLSKFEPVRASTNEEIKGRTGQSLVHFSHLPRVLIDMFRSLVALLCLLVSVQALKRSRMSAAGE